MTIEERLERLTGIVEILPSTVVFHDGQVEGLIKAGEAQQKRLDKLAESVAATERQWQAYITTLPRQ